MTSTATYAAWFADHMLQRPDFHVFGSTAEVDEAGAFLDDLHRSVAAPSSRRPVPAPPGPNGGT